MGWNARGYPESNQKTLATEQERKTKSRMAMDERARRLKGAEPGRTASGTGRRRITKASAGKFADYSKIKSSTGIVIPEVKRVILDRKKRDAANPVHRTNIIYPSEMARADWCPRATYYRMSGRPDPGSTSSFVLENIFAEGNAIHSKWQRWLAATGKLWGDWRCQRCSEYVRNSTLPDEVAVGSCIGTSFVDLSGELEENYSHDWKYKEVTLASTTHKISGHADGGLIGHDCLIELKSVGIGTMRFDAPKMVEEHTYKVGSKSILDIEGLWKNLHHPLLAHVKQGNIYLWMAQQMGLPFDKIVFLYEFKANQQVKEFSVRMSDDIMAPMLDTASQIEYHLANGTPPECVKGKDGCGNCRPYEKEG